MHPWVAAVWPSLRLPACSRDPAGRPGCPGQAAPKGGGRIASLPPGHGFRAPTGLPCRISNDVPTRTPRKEWSQATKAPDRRKGPVCPAAPGQEAKTPASRSLCCELCCAAVAARNGCQMQCAEGNQPHPTPSHPAPPHPTGRRSNLAGVSLRKGMRSPGRSWSVGVGGF